MKKSKGSSFSAAPLQKRSSTLSPYGSGATASPRVGVAIMAAGTGSGLKSQLPNVLHEVGGKPLLEHVIRAAVRIVPAKDVYAIIGYEADRVRAAMEHTGVNFVLQAEQRGTGHAENARPGGYDIEVYRRRHGTAAGDGHLRIAGAHRERQLGVNLIAVYGIVIYKQQRRRYVVKHHSRGAQRCGEGDGIGLGQAGGEVGPEDRNQRTRSHSLVSRKARRIQHSPRCHNWRLGKYRSRTSES